VEEGRVALLRVVGGLDGPPDVEVDPIATFDFVEELDPDDWLEEPEAEDPELDPGELLLLPVMARLEPPTLDGLVWALEEVDPELDPEEALCTVEEPVAVEDPDPDNPEDLVTTEVDPPDFVLDLEDGGAEVDEFVDELAEQEPLLVITGGRGGFVG
jgi:hypothetical protein